MAINNGMIRRIPDTSEIIPPLTRFARNTISTSALWTSAGGGTGAAAMAPAYLLAQTGTTAGSTIVSRIVLAGLNPGGTIFHANFAKRLIYSGTVRFGANAAGITKAVQIKASTALGDLVAVGIGVKVDGTVLYGESFGVSRGEVVLANPVAQVEYSLVIDHDPQKGVITWYINGAIAGTQTDADKIPNASTGATTYLLATARNGATTTNATLYITPPDIYVQI